MKKYGTLRSKVYKYLRREMGHGDLKNDPFIDQDKICDHLKISRAPLRDALIQLEAEGFVRIIPRQGVRIEVLTLKDVKNYYNIIAAIESYEVRSNFHKLKSRHIKRMEEINRNLYEMLDLSRYKKYYKLNLKFHDVFLSLSRNKLIGKTIYPLKQRLYDFPRMHYDKEWERINLSEHERFIQAVKAENMDAAVAVIRNEHWNFDLHKEKIIKIYGQ